ncbi:hypothetical protein [Actinokineospora spheciospongiae]|uniref:hypothetical protein n=1 Tax=Actinokineospora spheciospongiae TaxID=909613 RepID=UPI000D712A3D|nr:hypothetical protein [Actinokineospora spheciospongiae]PWW63335.1 hypothetical protein DFQ13_104325 [Actinokineospora spheciospongiae]
MSEELAAPEPTSVFGRRALLRAGVGLAAVAGVGAVSTTPAAAAPAAPPVRAPYDPRTGATSANGWPVESSADAGGAVWTRPVPGSDLRVALRVGAVEAVLVHVVRRYHYEVDALRAGEVTGFRATGLSRRGPDSNFGSGTAVAIRPGWYPAGTTGDLTGFQRAVIADIVASCAGVVRWGGTFATPWEAHFQIDVAPGDPRLTRVAELVGAGRGAGALVLGA